MKGATNIRRVLLASLLVLAQASTLLAPDVSVEEEIATLIRDLGAGSYQARERATRRLWQIGAPAVAALEKAARCDDPEVRTRADLILLDIRAGIKPTWPEGLIDLARSMDGRPEDERRNALERMVTELKGKALGFLLGRLTAEVVKDRAHALECIKKLAAADEGTYRRVLELLPKPANDYQAQVLVLARVHTGNTLAALKLMSTYDVNSRQRREIVTKAVENILSRLGRYDFDRAAKEAAEFARAAPADARFAYLHAEAVSALGDDRRAASLRETALALNSKAEAPHYTAGEMLQHKLGRRGLAEKEWKKILSIPPEGRVYDMNAHLRLHSIYAECGLHGRAAEHLNSAVTLIEDAKKGGGGVGIVGGSIETLRKRVEDLRAKARSRPPGAGAAVRDKRPDKQIDLGIQVSVKDGKLRKLREALAKVAATLTINVQPRGIRLFEKGVLAVRYDAASQQVGVYLNDSACGKPAPLRLGDKPARIAIRSLDCCYIYEVPRGGGPAKLIDRFEKDYRLKLRPGNKIAACRGLAVTINGKAHAWKDLLAGVTFDYLPEKLAIAVEGTHPSGEPLKLKINVTPTDPPVKPLRPATSAPAPKEK